jgi:hypothetical protein
MIVFDFICSSCGKIEEKFIDRDVEQVECVCGSPMTKYFGNSAGGRLPDETGWLRTIPEVVDKESRTPIDVEMRRNPTRENLKRWMGYHGLRHMEDNEKVSRPKLDIKRHADAIMKMRMERNRIEIGR